MVSIYSDFRVYPCFRIENSIDILDVQVFHLNQLFYNDQLKKLAIFDSTRVWYDTFKLSNNLGQYWAQKELDDFRRLNKRGRKSHQQTAMGIENIYRVQFGD